VKSPIALLAALIVFGAVTTGCVNREAQKVAKETQQFIQDKTITVRAQAPVVKSISEELEISGSMLSADDAQVGAQIGGRIVAVYVKDGDPVAAGQVIAKQDTTDYQARVRQAQAQVRQAQAQYAAARTDQSVGPDRTSAAVKSAEARLASARSNLAKLRAGDRPEQRKVVAAQVAAAKSNLSSAKKDLDRYRSLFKDGAISQQEVDRQENAYQQALAQYEQALENQRMQQIGPRQEDIRSAENDVRASEQALADVRASKRNDVQFSYKVDQAQSAIQSAQESLAIAQMAVHDAEVRAPFSGTVSGKPLAVGTYAGPGTPLARIIGGDGVYFEGEVPESKLSSVQLGANVEVRIDALSGQVLTGVVKAINPQGSDTSRLFKVRIQIQSAGSGIRPGMFAKGRIQTKTVADAMVVPSTAVLGAEGERYVFIADGSKAKKVKVAVGIQKGSEIQVSGIDPSAQVVVDGQIGLIDGSPIKVEKKA